MYSTISIYAIAKEPITDANSYPHRFLRHVFKSKRDALAALPKMARDFIREEFCLGKGISGGEFLVAVIRGSKCDIEYQSGVQPNALVKKTLIVEKLDVVDDGRVRFDDGAGVDIEDWDRLLIKDWDCRYWDWGKWTDQFANASTYPETAEHSIKWLLARCDWWKFAGVDYRDDMRIPAFLEACPWFMDHKECSGLKLMPEGWGSVLKKHPEFGKRCKCWNRFNEHVWASLLLQQPQFADKCSKWEEMPESEVALLIEKWPDLESRFSPSKIRAAKLLREKMSV